jgi:hypothetical protein
VPPSHSTSQSSSKDPAQPHPDDLPQPNPSTLTPPAEQRSLTTVNNLGGYTLCEPTPALPLSLPKTRPSLSSILKNHRAANPSPHHQTLQPIPRPHSAQTHRSTIQNTTPTDPPRALAPNPQLPQYRHLFQPILSPRHTVIPRPYITAPQPYDVEGQHGAQDAPPNSATTTPILPASATLPIQPFATDSATNTTIRPRTPTSTTTSSASIAPTQTTTAPNATPRKSYRRPADPSQTIDHSPPTSTPPPRRT